MIISNQKSKGGINLKKHRLIYTILLLFIVITLSGCIDAKFHLTVNKDGSGDFSYQMLMDPTLLAFTADYNNGTDDDALTEMINDAKESGFTITNLNENGKVGFKADKHINNLQEELKGGELFGQENMDSSIKPGEGLIVDEGFFKTRYKFKMDFDMSDMLNNDLGEFDEIDNIAQSMIKSMNFSFALTLPVSALTHNAGKTEDDGKTLVWTLLPGQKNEIEMTAEVWNVKNIALLIALIILFAILAIMVAKRKKSNNQYIDPPDILTNPPASDLPED